MPNRTAAGVVRRSAVIPLDQASSFWQPIPANGFVRCILDSASVGAHTPFSMGTQTVDPGCHVREHTHDRHDEVIHVLAGHGAARLDGVLTAIAAGSTIYIGANLKHGFHAAPDAALTFLWLLMPGGLETFFAAIGRPRTPGEPAPAPFPRPPDIAAIEARTVFGWTDQSDPDLKPPATDSHPAG